MDFNILIEHSHKDSIGKYFFSKAVTFAINYEFGKSYEYFKEGLDVLTCDCSSGGWLKPYRDINKKIFDDINIKHLPHFEYYFVKAYIMSYEDDNRSQFIALDAIEQYLEVKDDEYGNYVKGKILLKLNEYQQAFECFELASSFNLNQRILYRLGRTKEELLGQDGLEEIYYSFIQNPLSSCNIRVLKKQMREREYVLELNENETNPLLLAFNGGDVHFFYLYNKFLDIKLAKNEDLVYEENASEIFNSFIQGITNNSELFVGDNTEDDYAQDYDDYFEHDSYSDNDFINDVLGGDPDSYWNID